MTHDPARGRFAILMAVRFAGVAVALLGVVNTARRVIEPADVVGTGLVVIGMAGMLVVPRILARRWRTPSAP